MYYEKSQIKKEFKLETGTSTRKLILSTVNFQDRR